jgi:hypothetical protein
MTMHTSLRLLLRRARPVLVAVVAACADVRPLDPVNEWEVARARWAERGPSHYTYESRSTCFCIVNVTFWHRVEVKDGQVIGVTRLQDFPFPDLPTPSAWQTIPVLFDRARPAEASSVVVERIVEYDPALGYPRRIDVRCSRMVADCDNTVETRNLVAVATAGR